MRLTGSLDESVDIFVIFTILRGAPQAFPIPNVGNYMYQLDCGLANRNSHTVTAAQGSESSQLRRYGPNARTSLEAVASRQGECGTS